MFSFISLIEGWFIFLTNVFLLNHCFNKFPALGGGEGRGGPLLTASSARCAGSLPVLPQLTLLTRAAPAARPSSQHEDILLHQLPNELFDDGRVVLRFDEEKCHLRHGLECTPAKRLKRAR